MMTRKKLAYVQENAIFFQKYFASRVSQIYRSNDCFTHTPPAISPRSTPISLLQSNFPSLFFPLQKYPTRSNFCCLNTHGCNAIHWSSATSLENSDSPSPRSLTVNSSSVRYGSLMNPSYLHAIIFTGLILCRSCMANHRCLSLSVVVCLFQKILFCNILPNI